tara:strand:- start:53 stop:256 length:204 start_codon:yes stop_codon:yes gene_type:complete
MLEEAEELVVLVAELAVKEAVEMEWQFMYRVLTFMVLPEQLTPEEAVEAAKVAVEVLSVPEETEVQE